MDKEASLIEAVLFLEVEPVTLEKIVKITQLSHEAIKQGFRILEQKYSLPNSGIFLSEIEGSWSLTLKPEAIDCLKAYYGKRSDGRLSKSLLETLSIIAYSQPLTRGEVESIRGVNCTSAIKILQEKNLIKEVGRREGPGRPLQYGTTRDFLQLFDLRSISDLPKLDETERAKFELHIP